MFKNILSVDVCLGDRKVGRLAWTPNRRCLFEYDTEWVKSGFSISPFYLPLKHGVITARAEPFEGLFGIFHDSLPDGWGKLLTDRWLISKGFNPQEFTVIDRLSLVGDSGMGALTYHPAQNTQGEEMNYPVGFYAAESARILNSDFSGSLDEMVQKAGSSGGARPKVLLNIDGVGWLIKFRAAVDPADVGKIEYEHSVMAERCGIEMPETRLFEGKYFGVRRFDHDGHLRIHVHSAAGLLYASYRLPSLDYTELMKATMALTRDIQEVEKLFRLMIFNVLIGNKDDHAKNFSYRYINNRWQLSPAYDLLPSPGFNLHHTTTVNGKGKPVIDDCMEVAKVTGFPVKQAGRIVEEVKAGVNRGSLAAWNDLTPLPLKGRP